MFTNSSGSSLQPAKIMFSKINTKNLEQNSSLSNCKLESIKVGWSGQCAGHTSGECTVVLNTSKVPQSEAEMWGHGCGHLMPLTFPAPVGFRDRRREQRPPIGT